MDFLNPPINTSGMFKVTATYNTLVRPNIEYKITGCYSHEELLGFNIRVFEVVYQAVGLTAVDMNTDIDNKVPIYTLTSESGNKVHLPASHLLSYPQVSGVLYQGKTLVVSTGAIPLSFNLDTIVDNIKELVSNRTGRDPGITVVPSTATTLVTEADNQNFINNIGGNTNNIYNRVTTLSDELNMALVKINELEQFISDNI